MVNNKNLYTRFLFSLVTACFFFASPLMAQKKNEPKPVPPLSVGKDGELLYEPDSLGNRIPDFSYAGYMGGARAIPAAPVKVTVPLKQGDATLRIQSALDYVSSLPLNKDGIRGVVLLEKGVYQIEGGLTINASGVVLRGSGMGQNGTVLYAAGKDRETLIRIQGTDDKKAGKPVKVAQSYVPVNAMTLELSPGHGFKKGDKIFIHRPSTKEWLEALGTLHFGGGLTTLGWKPGDRDIYWDRTITGVEGNEISIDAPVTTALDARYGGATVESYEWNGRISQTGVENIRLRSAFDKNNLKDENHRWMAITMEHLTDSWVRQVVFEHFAGSAVAVLETAKRITVEDCKSLAPVSEIGGQRRYTFFTLGQQTLFQRCYAEYGYHDFAVGFGAAGPNAFVQCESHLPFSFSGAIDSWASGVLFDVVNVDGHALSYFNRGQDNNGSGWTAANSVFWQCAAARIDCYAPPTANNWAFGSWAQFAGDGYWNNSNEHIKPRSLYYGQLAQRLGREVLSRAYLLDIGTEASSSPPVSVAAELTAQSVNPAPQLKDWIDQAAEREPIAFAVRGVKTIDQIGLKSPAKPAVAAPMQVRNGWLVRGSTVVTGGRHDVPWWRGTLQPVDIKASKPAVTRFVPGRTGLGLTDDLAEVTDWMKEQNIVSLEHNYGLWYDRRRDDHERVRRMDGEVWAPFYEQPFARSGQGTAWDGLSKYDLSTYNFWYWNRLKQFVDLADQKGLFLVHQNYFQHNILEAGAHYADFPWRTANNINNTGFPEPPPYAGDKRIFLAEQFYDISDAGRRALHRAYIRQCLDNFKDNTGVIQLISAEFTGPLQFVEFWVDVIREWEKETGRNALIGLSATKDVQDAILQNAERAAAIDIIDIRYWYYQADGSAYAPEGGQNLAPRQQGRLFKPKKTSFEQVYRAVSEYRRKHPDKAVMFSAQNYDSMAWAAFMAGGSVTKLPADLDKGFLSAASSMVPQAGTAPGTYVLQGDDGLIAYSEAAGPLKLDLRKYKGSISVVRMNASGKVISEEKAKGGGDMTVDTSAGKPLIIWVKNT